MLLLFSAVCSESCELIHLQGIVYVYLNVLTIHRHYFITGTDSFD